MFRTLKLQHLALSAIWPACMLYLGATSLALAQSGDGPAGVAGVIVDQDDVLFGDIDDVIVTTACLEGNPFVPDDPPLVLGSTPTLSGCKLDIPGTTMDADADNNQLIVVLPNNYQDGDVLTSVRTFGSGSNTGIEADVTVRAVSKDIFLGLANPGLFEAVPGSDTTSDVDSTADVFCTSIDDGFDCARVEPGNQNQDLSCPSGLSIVPDEPFCSRLTGLLDGAYNLEANPLAYATTTNMTSLAQPGSVTLRLCPGFQAQCLSPAGSPTAAIQGNVRVTSMHTQASFVETPRTRCCYF